MTTLSKKQRKMRNRILIAAALLVLVKLLPLTGWVRGLCCLAPYFIIGYDVLRKAALGLSLIHISEPTRHALLSRMPSSA